MVRCCGVDLFSIVIDAFSYVELILLLRKDLEREQGFGLMVAAKRLCMNVTSWDSMQQ